MSLRDDKGGSICNMFISIKYSGNYILQFCANNQVNSNFHSVQKIFKWEDFDQVPFQELKTLLSSLSKTSIQIHFVTLVWPGGQTRSNNLTCLLLCLMLLFLKVLSPALSSDKGKNFSPLFQYLGKSQWDRCISSSSSTCQFCASKLRSQRLEKMAHEMFSIRSFRCSNIRLEGITSKN